jgi:hypothetical protein
MRPALLHTDAGLEWARARQRATDSQAVHRVAGTMSVRTAAVPLERVAVSPVCLLPLALELKSP